MLEYFYKNSAHISQTKQITPLKIFPLSHFNPRSREGSDLFFRIYVLCRSISIHAPARGATIPMAPDIHDKSDFNPRSREGSDFYYFFGITQHPYFNPRSREGSD